MNLESYNFLKVNRNSLVAMFALGLLGVIGCDTKNNDYVEYVPMEPDTDTGESRDTGDPTYDTEPDPNETFEYDLTGVPYKGVNVSSAEFGNDQDASSDNIPGYHGTTYVWPDAVYVTGYDSPKKFMQMGMTVIRLPFGWERLQPTLKGEFNVTELERLRLTTFHMLSEGATVILDVHNYARYQRVTIVDGKYVREPLTMGEGLTSEDLADLWRRLALMFKDYPRVFFGLMNEPHHMETEVWVDAANASIQAIRDTGAQNMILVPGNAWSGAQSWYESWYGTSNAVAMLEIDDSAGNVIYEVHQYSNEDNSGWDGGCVSETIAAERMSGFTNWLRTNNKKGLLGEFGVLGDATCQTNLRNQLQHMEDNSDVWVGWTYWAASPKCPGWAAPVDPFCYDEVPVQMQILQEFL